MIIRMSKKYFFVDIENFFDYKITINKELKHEFYQDFKMSFLKYIEERLDFYEDDPSLIIQLNNLLIHFSTYITFKDSTSNINHIKHFNVSEDVKNDIKHMFYTEFINKKYITVKETSTFLNKTNLIESIELILIKAFPSLRKSLGNILDGTHSLEEFSIQARKSYPFLNDRHIQCVYEGYTNPDYMYSFSDFISSFIKGKNIVTQKGYMIETKKSKEIISLTDELIYSLDDNIHFKIIENYREKLIADRDFRCKRELGNYDDVLSHLDLLIQYVRRLTNLRN